MWILKLFLVIAACSSYVYCEICTNNTKTCFCKHVTDENTHLPVSVAYCAFRGMEALPDSLETDLNVLDLSCNSIQILDKRWKSNNLRVLNLGSNRISKVDSDMFQDLPELVELDFSNNLILSFEDGTVFRNLEKLSRLDLSSNSLVSLPGGVFLPLTQLRYLDISYNYFGDLLMSSGSVLSKLLQVTPDLTHLRMNGLNLTELSPGYFDDFEKMTSLTLTDNELDAIPLVPNGLRKLDLSGNLLTQVSARYLNYPKLKELKLNRMPTLTDIHHYAFYNLFALEKLSITDCPNLEVFSELAFDVASKNDKLHPKTLILARNGLKILNETYKYFFRHMDQVDLRRNPWNCDCDILWLRDYDHVLYKPEEIRCNTPRALKRKSVLELNEKDLNECYPEIYGKKSHRILIVALTLAIITLCGVIFYLVRYPTSWFSNGRTVGPASPYSLASTSEIK